MGDLRYQWVIGVGVCQHGADREENWAEGAIVSSRAPLVSEDVKADASVRVDVGVVDEGGKVDLGRFEGVIGGEMYSKKEDTTGIRAVTLSIAGK
ncbi:hypothetical protein ACO22_08148 [Paracoccidioides brasiliensis]|uniref:Uncharacterized protein n=1 Tax=Paracoccidioides brasiliensis TaxID=121759 RepID=A0A1D2J2N0_PARBR|nr:hypothetical protein ACO22_08148 [Paracoccidioides brasiliensis]